MKNYLLTQTQDNKYQDAFKALAELIADEVLSRMPKVENEPQPNNERIRLNGIRGIANYLKCSVKTAQDLKDKNLFPVYWVGSKLYTYSDEVESGLKKGGKRK